jgi:glycerol-3-phosphate dehydrogenase (NAD(P)+)
MSIAVLGGGAWGTAMAIHLAAHAPAGVVVRLWARDAAQVADMRQSRSNTRYLPGRTFPDALEVVGDVRQALNPAEVDLVLIATPTAALREVAAHVARLAPRAPVVCLSKGIEPGGLKLSHEIIGDLLGHDAWAMLSGPSFADELARGLPTALTLAGNDESTLHALQQKLHRGAVRVYTSDDVIGVEVGGAVKNVLAIATGICDGMQLGMNARAALITRGLVEMTRLCVALGGRAETTMGLTGLGDLVLTATGDLSRNRTVGLRLAQGDKLEAILAELGHVAEGVRTAEAVFALADRNEVEMPITAAVCAVLQGMLTPSRALEALLAREARAEFRGAKFRASRLAL